MIFLYYTSERFVLFHHILKTLQNQGFPALSSNFILCLILSNCFYLAEKLATERRDACVRYTYFVLNLYFGWYSLPLYLQMVRWRWLTAISLGLCAVKTQKRKPPVFAVLGAFACVRHLFCSLPAGIISYVFKVYNMPERVIFIKSGSYRFK